MYFKQRMGIFISCMLLIGNTACNIPVAAREPDKQAIDIGAALRSIQKIYLEKTGQQSESPMPSIPQEEKDALPEETKLRNYQSANFARYIDYKQNHPDYTYEQVVTYVNIGLDKPFYSQTQLTANPDNSLVLVNKYNSLPADYVPEGYTPGDGRVHRLRADAQSLFDQMRLAAQSDGAYIWIISGYRSYSVQQSIYQAKKSQNPGSVDSYNARAGFSEHQTGLAADLNSLSAGFANTWEYKWLKENAHKYGFIERYPSNAKWVTGYSGEPWHWRYVGVDAAAEIKALGITFDEYYAIYLMDRNPEWQGDL